MIPACLDCKHCRPLDWIPVILSLGFERDYRCGHEAATTVRYDPVRGRSWNTYDRCAWMRDNERCGLKGALWEPK